MFDLDGENLWMGPKPRKSRGKSTRSVRRKYYIKPKKRRRTTTTTSGFSGITRTFTESSKTKYQRREKALKAKLEEQRYKRKLQNIKAAEKSYAKARRDEKIYKAKETGKKIGGFFSRFKKKKSIYGKDKL